MFRTTQPFVLLLMLLLLLLFRGGTGCEASGADDGGKMELGREPLGALGKPVGRSDGAGKSHPW